MNRRWKFFDREPYTQFLRNDNNFIDSNMKVHLDGEHFFLSDFTWLILCMRFGWFDTFAAKEYPLHTIQWTRNSKQNNENERRTEVHYRSFICHILSTRRIAQVALNETYWRKAFFLSLYQNSSIDSFDFNSLRVTTTTKTEKKNEEKNIRYAISDPENEPSSRPNRNNVEFHWKMVQGNVRRACDGTNVTRNWFSITGKTKWPSADTMFFDRKCFPRCYFEILYGEASFNFSVSLAVEWNRYACYFRQRNNARLYYFWSVQWDMFNCGHILWWMYVADDDDRMTCPVTNRWCQHF